MSFALWRAIEVRVPVGGSAVVNQMPLMRRVPAAHARMEIVFTRSLATQIGNGGRGAAASDGEGAGAAATSLGNKVAAGDRGSNLSGDPGFGAGAYQSLPQHHGRTLPIDRTLQFSHVPSAAGARTVPPTQPLYCVNHTCLAMRFMCIGR